MAITAGLLTACAPHDVGATTGASHPAGTTPSPSASAQDTAPPRYIAPLTGLPAASAAAADRPAVALVLSGQHLYGLGQADMVFEEITSPIRYIAVFQSQQATLVGPITSTRPTDGMVLSVLHPLVGYAGGTPGFVDVLDHTKVIDLGQAGHSSLYRQVSWGLAASTVALERAAHSSQPPPLLSYRGEGLGTGHTLAATGVVRRSSVRVQLPGGSSIDWQFRPALDRWIQVSGGPPASVANLIIQIVGYKQVFVSHREGITVPSARVLGVGRAMVFTGLEGSGATGSLGLGVAANWSKPGMGDVTNYLAADYSVLNFAPGPTWVILAPPGARVLAGS
jgi:hypothetical protein